MCCKKNNGWATEENVVSVTIIQFRKEGGVQANDCEGGFNRVAESAHKGVKIEPASG